MSNSAQVPHSNDPYTPPIPRWLCFAEKANFAGNLIAGMLYGTVIILFFQCMGALSNPASHMKRSVKWLLVAHTAAMFSFVTIFTALNLDLLSISYIDNRGFFGHDVLPPGPFGYQFLIYSKPITVTPYVMFFLNNLLADGLLLYRCCIIYAMNHWVIVFPCLMYLASSVTGVILIYQNSQPDVDAWTPSTIHFGYSYFLVCLSLNGLLTVMIIARLVLHSRSIRKSMGTPEGTSGVCKTIVAMFVESFALYTANFLLVIGSWGARSYLVYTFFPILAETQVIAPFLTTLRVATRSAPASTALAPRDVGSIDFSSRPRSMDDDGPPPDGSPTSSTDTHRESPRWHETTVEPPSRILPW